MKKLFLITFVLSSLVVSAQQRVKTTAGPDAKQLKKAERREKINQLIKQEEEGALIFQKQGAFGFKFNTDGWGMFYEHGKYKTITKTNLWWLEFGERKHPKEEKIPTLTASQGFLVVSSYIYGKQNNFYYLKAGLGQQTLIGGKGNKNGVAVSAIYGGGLTAGLLKPYYIEIENPTTHAREQIKYDNNDALFLDPTIIIGKGGLFKGFNEIKFVPGAHARAALRFDYGRYNELLSAIEVGVNAEYYSKAMPIMLLNKENKFFFNAYISLVFGKRK
ncbi:hypothetical protein GWC95_14745 [Sediminibacterium roseum]|uniref:Outer membrane protein beta-barrel domain-containing protein n=1 Tax=Sediminibacterium roseum TaxID=1978412 RepID=A0ABX0A1A1_9BACT|nr:hypothetical protein [Sediminibacterium roseum]NCI51188.1 hypothetical protein [Sediminibacterium roseum]